MHYTHHTAHKLLQENTNYIPPNEPPSITESDNQLKINFSDFVHNHRQFSFETERTNGNINIHQNKYRRTIEDSASDDESDAEPSPTPIISDLEDEDDVLCDTPNIQRVTDLNDIKEASFPLHGISIPYNFDDDDSDTPEPLDTPITPGFECSFNTNLEELKLSSDENDSDIDYAFIMDDAPPALFPVLSPKSRSWQHITMTRMTYKRCKRIKSITPITQEMAERNINNIYCRRRSVANITPTVHRLFKLDADLLKIREEYLQKNKTKESDSVEEEDYDDDDDEERENDRSKTERFCVKVNRIKIPK